MGRRSIPIRVKNVQGHRDQVRVRTVLKEYGEIVEVKPFSPTKQDWDSYRIPDIGFPEEVTRIHDYFVMGKASS
ncbi:Hypothetical predicted protein [Octopus vulgaris]|uniref:Uncharacterized protein n=1 Tax=Octopus vulgaris TaxID=6645 RepID=A0AA36BAC0_OCTVU|nr:Hypothetical predicted protein [Octopus vulgaris]